MTHKKCNVRVLIGNKVVRNEKIDESLVSDYISSFRKFYRKEAKVEIS